MRGQTGGRPGFGGALLNEYRFRSLTAATDIYGLVGLPVSHSVSPAMHNAAFAATRLDAVYLPLPAVSADDFVTFGRALGVKGVSVTIPHKISLFERVDEVDAVARRIGALNTIRVIDDRWVGGNTDVEGFLSPLVNRVAVKGLKASILGSGGAALAVAVAFVVERLSRPHPRAQSPACRGSRRRHLGGGRAVPAGTRQLGLLVNCTPVGMYPNVGDTPIEAAGLTGRYVYDLVYNPTGTRLLCDAARPAARRSVASRCSSLRPTSSSTGGPACVRRGNHAGSRAQAACGVHTP